MAAQSRSAGSTVTIPTALAVPSSQLLFGEVSYAYTPAVGYTITGTLNLSDQMYIGTAYHRADLRRHHLYLTVKRAAATSST